jgi:hypothetical protein
MTDGLYAKDLEHRPLSRRRTHMGNGGGRQRWSWWCHPELCYERYQRMRQPGRGSLEDHPLPNLTAIEVRGQGVGRRRVRNERRLQLAYFHRGNRRAHHDVVTKEGEDHEQP